MSVEPPKPTKISDVPIEPDSGTSYLTKFLYGNIYYSGISADELYRHLVEHHMKENTLDFLLKAIQGEMITLPNEIQEQMDNQPEFSEKTIDNYAIKKEFWEQSTGKEAFYEFMGIFCKMPSVPDDLKELISKKFIIRRYDVRATHYDLLEPEIKLHDIAFSIFQIITLRFACLAHTNKELRELWGIRKGLIFR